MGKRTPLYDCHGECQAKLVDFAGWDMPIHYGSQLQEHHHVRQDAGLFDVSHMTIIDVEGTDASAFLRYALANNVDRLVPNKALYTCMLNEQGGVIDDLIVYQCAENDYRLVVNSSTRDKDLAWLEKIAQAYQCRLHERAELAMVALQGPLTRTKMAALFSSADMQIIAALKPFHFAQLGQYFIACTGYTGEDGFEIILPSNEAPAFWRAAVSHGFAPCGLGARDTLRLEAGLNLYGADMDESVTPFESNLAWTVALGPTSRDFVGRHALEAQLQQGVPTKLVGLVLQGQGVLRNHQKVLVEGVGEGEITSGSFSPTLNKGIALARVPTATGENCLIEIRGKWVPATVIKPPFVPKQKSPPVNKMMMEQE